MTTYVGADWADGLWVLVAVKEDALQIHTEPAIFNAWQEYDSDTVFLIDMPIGLPEKGTRACDKEASEYLKSRRNTVFTVPTRDAVYTRDYKRAKVKNKDAGSDSLGSQSWWLIPRIKEVDIFLQEYSDAKARVYESHPELCFAKLAGGKALPKKETKDGLSRRLELLKRLEPELAQDISEFVNDRANGAAWYHRIQSGRIDDVLDAAVLAFTGKRLNLSTTQTTDSYPAYPTSETPTDRTGLPMEIIYPVRES